MTVSSRALVEFILLGPQDDRRQLQDSPILGDVWIAFADKPAQPMDLLITPHRTWSAGRVAAEIARRLGKLGRPRAKSENPRIAYLQGVVAARLYFTDVLRVIVPMTEWWEKRGVMQALRNYDAAKLITDIDALLQWARADGDTDAEREIQEKAAAELAQLSALDRYLMLAALIVWAGGKSKGVGASIVKSTHADKIAVDLLELFKKVRNDERPPAPQVFQVSMNRKAMPALTRSVPAIKADAARTLFNVKCGDIGWAVIDSGIDGKHHAFNDEAGTSRILKCFDFRYIRQIVSLDNLDPDPRKATVDELSRERGFKNRAAEAEFRKTAIATLELLAKNSDNDQPIQWDEVTKLVEIDPTTTPPASHGTHVAGIIGASALAVRNAAAKPGTRRATEPAKSAADDSDAADGVCPDIKLYDFRVLSKSLDDTEFAIIAALQFIRFLNERHSYMSIHGANLSLSIPHDVRNYACGRTPVCDECERLVNSGVVVVAAAGNRGYQRYETKDGGGYEGYTAFSITDPGNADEVITVGATHRYWPHTYGVSFFSSRGPTGDGRMKPDLVAPGERIKATLPGNAWGDLDGTSMAAPHVSGAAAMLMARYSELIGQPRRIKRILCESATDLARERSFQGHGMLDALRAFQSI